MIYRTMNHLLLLLPTPLAASLCMNAAVFAYVCMYIFLHIYLYTYTRLFVCCMCV